MHRRTVLFRTSVTSVDQTPARGLSPLIAGHSLPQGIAMKIWRTAVFGMLAVVALSACTGTGPTEAEDRQISLAFDQARHGDGALLEQLAPQIRTAETPQALLQVRDIIQNAGTPCERTRTYFSATNITGTSGASRTVTTRHQYACPNHYLVVDTEIHSTDGAPPLISRLIVTPVDSEAARAAQIFTLEGKSTRQIAFFIMAASSPVLMLIAFLGVLFTRNFKRKWLWAIASFVGLAKFSMIWPTGEIQSQLASINLLGFGLTRYIDALSPWVVSFTPPVGALVVLSLLWPRWAGLNGAEEPESTSSKVES